MPIGGAHRTRARAAPEILGSHGPEARRRERMAMTTRVGPDLFGYPPLPRVRLARQIDQVRPCHDNLATIHPRATGLHAAELRCATCAKFRGWMPRQALEFVDELTKKYGAPRTPIILRDSTIRGDGDMAFTK